MDVDKLHAILKEYGQYPKLYRRKIWEYLLQLPNNKDQYHAIANHSLNGIFDNLWNEYPLENKIAFKNLKRVLNNLAAWCPFFAHIKNLPLFVFPFVKVFQDEPIIGFEAISTIIG